MYSLSYYVRQVYERIASERSITFLGTGPSTPIEGVRKNKRLNTSTLITDKDNAYLIDIPPTFKEGVTFNYLLLTHLHRDAFGGFNKIKNREFTLVVPQRLSDDIKYEGSRLILKQGKSNNVGSLRITSFSVPHDIIYKMPTYGYQFIFSNNKKLTYASDIVGIPKEIEKYFNNIDILIIDGAGWEYNIVTHFGILPFLELVQDRGWKIGKIYFNQIGRPVPKHEEAQRIITRLNSKAYLSNDGLRINI